MGDRGLPRSLREMPGYGSHTYQWINAAGEQLWVKYHFSSNQGNEQMEGSEAERIAGTDSDYYRRDLYEAIEAGNFPSWDVSVQVMPYDDAKTYRFNPFDVTKVWPHSDYPLIPVGTHTINRNPENFFAPIEQPSPRRTRCRESGSAPTRCCRRGCSPARTHSAIGLEPTSPKSR